MLYIVATPIGNLKDITLRALEVLKEVDFILCEDTRVTLKLLNRYGIQAKGLISYHQHTGTRKTAELLDLILRHKVALVTDAGTPGISDPGGLLIRALRNCRLEASNENIEIEVVPIPGPSAVTAALSISGFPTDKFLFLGFIPHKKGRHKFLKRVLESAETVVFYESKYRIIKSLEQLGALEQAAVKKKQACVCRELTKKFESIYRGSLAEVLAAVGRDEIKGEYVVIVR